MPRDPTSVPSVLCHATYIDPDTYNTVIVHVGRDDDRREERQEGTTDD